jgi:hypothetical protein
MPRRTKRYDAVAWLDPPIVVLRRATAGRSYAVRIEGQPMQLTLPKSGPDSLTLE